MCTKYLKKYDIKYIHSYHACGIDLLWENHLPSNILAFTRCL